MKRLREIETRIVASEMVTLANEVQIDTSSAVLLLFSAVEPLMETLRHRPILVINIMLASKSLLNLFTRQITGLWRVLIDQLVVNEVGGTSVDQYPFFLVQCHAQIARCERVMRSFAWPERMARAIQRKESFIRRYSWLDVRYHPFEMTDVTENTVVYADGLVSRYIDLALYFKLISDEALVVAVGVDGFQSDFDVDTEDHPLDVIYAPEGEGGFHIRFIGDVAVMTRRAGLPPHGVMLRRLLLTIRDRTQTMSMKMHALNQEYEVGDDDRDTHLFPRVVKQLIGSLLATVNALLGDGPQSVVGDGTQFDELTHALRPVIMSAPTLIPYRQTLFQTLYATAEAQRDLLLQLLRQLSMNEREDIVKRYGARCTSCGLATEFASPLTLLPCCENSTFCQTFGQ